MQFNAKFAIIKIVKEDHLKGEIKMEKYKGKFFNVGNDKSWTLEESFSDALTKYYILKNLGMKEVKIWDAITDTIIKS